MTVMYRDKENYMSSWSIHRDFKQKISLQVKYKTITTQICKSYIEKVTLSKKSKGTISSWSFWSDDRWILILYIFVYFSGLSSCNPF